MWHSELLLTFYVEDGINFLAVAQTNHMTLNRLCYLKVIFTFAPLPWFLSPFTKTVILTGKKLSVFVQCMA